MSLSKRRRAVVENGLPAAAGSIRVDGIGMQGHASLRFPSAESYEKSIIAFSEPGARVMVTELDVTVLPFPGNRTGADVSPKEEYSEGMNPYPGELPAGKAEEQRKRYVDFFRCSSGIKTSKMALGSISDKDSWCNGWPIFGRTDYPLLFDRPYRAKPVSRDIIKLATAGEQMRGPDIQPE